MKFTELKKALIDKYDWVKNHTWFKDKDLFKHIIEVIEERKQLEIDQLKLDNHNEKNDYENIILRLKSTIEEKNNEIGSLKYSLTESNKTKELLRNDLSNFKNTLSKKDLTISGLMANKTAYQKEIEILKSSLKACENALNESNKEINKFHSTCIEQCIKLSDSESTIKELQLINNQLQSRLTFLERNNHEGYSTSPFLPLFKERIDLGKRYGERLHRLARNGFSVNNEITEFIRNGHVIGKGWVMNATDEEWDLIMRVCNLNKSI